jgi:hypothetical protein
MANIEYACEGCPDVNEKLECKIWADPAELPYIKNQQCCPRNRKYEEEKKRVRVGQQKAKRMRGLR